MDASTIVAIATATVLIIGALVSGYLKIREARAVAVKLDTIHKLVDGQYSEVLDKLAEMSRAFADETGRRSDRTVADAAEKTADEHAARVEKALAPSPVAPAAPAELPK